MKVLGLDIGLVHNNLIFKPMCLYMYFKNIAIYYTKKMFN